MTRGVSNSGNTKTDAECTYSFTQEVPPELLASYAAPISITPTRSTESNLAINHIVTIFRAALNRPHLPTTTPVNVVKMKEPTVKDLVHAVVEPLLQLPS